MAGLAVFATWTLAMASVAWDYRHSIKRWFIDDAK